MDHKIRVLYIAGSGRSGSTLLQNIIAQIDGFTAVGEICFFWKRINNDSNYCGCSKPLNQCDFWNEILVKGFPDLKIRDSEKLNDYFYSGAMYQQLPKMMLPRIKRKIRVQMGEYIAALGKLYSTVHEVTKGKIIVDSSKFPSYGYILNQVPGIELNVIHLVRDSRAVAYSWLKNKESEPGTQMHRFNPIISGVSWIVYNLTTEYFWKRKHSKYIFLRYEDFILNPESELRRIISWLGFQPTQFHFISNMEVALETNHSVSGNPSRFSTGSVKLYLDNEWAKKMSKRNRFITFIFSWPYLLKYKYLRQHN